jgi:hypothetical protein
VTPRNPETSFFHSRGKHNMLMDNNPPKALAR